MLYSFAGFIIDIRFQHSYGKEMCERYAYHGGGKADFVIEVDEAMLAKEREYDLYKSSDGMLESLAAYRKICDIAFDYDCMFMHCSAISYKGNGILFTAPSGTGKSTHSALWKKHFGEDVTVVNDDKPLLKFQKDDILVCGTPWDGKHRQSANILVPIKAIVILSQGTVNEITRASDKEAMYHILNQTIRPSDAVKMGVVLEHCERMLSTVPIYTLKCTISDEAVMTVYNEIKEFLDEDKV